MNNQFIIILDIILLAMVLGFGLNWLYQWWQQRKLGPGLTNEDFEKAMRRGQIIDVREAKDFKAKHISGARNLPVTQMGMRYKELRQDMPVYVYSDSKALTLKAGNYLRKRGYDVKWLRDGFENWQGLTKKSKF
ncbi:MAG: rhodanese-like domain-containing protein [Lactobacillus sp.]|jgi:rhodanese-related sulfurtransferase